ncbi:hypothetical protein Hydth_0533 [Hydrogenobacter thermophilus TK-6]|uniref:Uncharacterized protein n=1 Tax=Hydrogenobacter thermophilus (strain DSM 6534 / IAM 12695 / TK-6) TaxID=608538 RepID=D3DGP6_HYDTT|nr:hypothetical protein [Hydrogenobacter thermophilus]ADO44933.1 hypothetical protein Hydth_0533 [Hydrogenobacter thermophilus TK-6]BAI68998.1 hypothetical protein HTH_0535 [Hydrogenobacter thermophilus TK-6]
MRLFKELSDSELLYCREIAKKIRIANRKYERACEILNGGRSVITIGQGKPAKNHVENAYVNKVVWQEFLSALDESEKKLVEEIVEGLDYFTKDELLMLGKINSTGQMLGLW